MRIADLDTPSLILDRRIFAANCDRMQAICRAKGVAHRPHMKTMKAIAAARFAIDPRHGGIAAATMNEAEYFAGHGVQDIQIAVCLTPAKIARAAALSRRIARLSFFVDSLDTAAAVAMHHRDTGEALRVWIEIDCGEGRTGLRVEAERLLTLAHALKRGGAIIEGVATHGGHSYGAAGAAAVQGIAEEERALTVRAAEILRAGGVDCPGVSIGSTPTAVHGASAKGATEIRAGVYMAGDLTQANLGAHGTGDIAATVLATVISHKPERHQIVIDAGGLALSKDRSTAAPNQRDYGYGLVLDINARDSFGGLIVGGVHQEHGEIARAGLPFDRLPVGAKVRLAPNHICMTAAMYDRFHVVDGGQDIVEHWPRTNGWT